MNICHADLNGDGSVEIANGAEAVDVEIVFAQLEKTFWISSLYNRSLQVTGFCEYSLDKVKYEKRKSNISD